MIKKMSLVGISFAFLGLAFICESANAIGGQICRESSAVAKPSSSNATEIQQPSAFCSNRGGLSGRKVWYCNSNYYYNGSNCVALPSGAIEDSASTAAQGGFLCGGSQYFINSPAPGCATLPSSDKQARSRRSVDNLPGYCPINVTCN